MFDKFDNPFDHSSGFTVDFNRVIDNSQYSSLVKFLAMTVQRQGYVSVGDFFKNISDSDLVYLVECIEAFEEMDELEYMGSDMVEEMMLMTLMLSQGEGGEEDSIEDMQRKIHTFCLLAVITSLYRRGLIDVNFENFSLQEDANDKIIAKRKPDVDYGSLLSEDDE